MRVLMLSPEYSPHNVGGLGRHVEELSEALVRNGHEITVLTWGQAGDRKREVLRRVRVARAIGYPISAMNFVAWVLHQNFKMLEEAIKLARETSFDLIHAHDWLVAYTAGVLKHAYKLPLVVTIHATEAGRNQGIHNEVHRYINSVEWWLTYEAWRVIACSEYMRYEVQGLFQLPPDKVYVIVNGVNTDKYRPGPSDVNFKAKYASPDEKIVLFVGRLVREKGVQVLLDAAPAVLYAYPRAKFVICGTGPAEQQLKEKAWSAGIGPKVYFTGYVPDEERNRLYQHASVVVVPSLYEPFGLVALEAMAAGAAVVVSDTGGLSDIVTHGVNGLKAYPGNVQSLAANILRLLMDETFSSQLSRRARELIARTYDWNEVALRTARLYLDVRREYKRTIWQEQDGDAHTDQLGKRPSPQFRYTMVDKHIASINQRRDY